MEHRPMVSTKRQLSVTSEAVQRTLDRIRRKGPCTVRDLIIWSGLTPHGMQAHLRVLRQANLIQDDGYSIRIVKGSSDA